MNVFIKRPLLRICSSFIAGILIAGHSVNVSYATYLFLAVLFLSWILIVRLNFRLQYRFRYISGILLHVCIALSSCIYTISVNKLKVSRLEAKLAPADFSLVYVSGTVEISNDLVKTELQLLSSKREGKWNLNNLKTVAAIRAKSKEQINTGDLLLIHGSPREVEGPANPHAFDYRMYLRNNGVMARLFVDSNEYKVMKSQFKHGLFEWSQQAKALLKNKLELHGISGECRSFLLALMLGDKTGLDRNEVSKYANAGIMHIMAVSGLHVGTIFLVLQLLFSVMRKKRFITNLLKTIIIIVALWFYCFITGLSASVLRACILLTYISIGNLFGRQTDSFNLLAASAVLLLLYKPLFIYDVGFQLSYAAVGGILLFYPAMYKCCSFSNSVADKIWGLLCASMAAQVSTFALGIYYFHQFPVYFLLSNLLIVPLAIFIFYTGIAYLTISWIAYAGDFLALILNSTVETVNQLVDLVALIPGGVMEGLHFSSFTVTMIYVLLISGFLYLKIKKSIYMYSTAICCVVLLLPGIRWKLKVNNQQAIIIYAVNGQQAIDFVSGRNHLFICDTSIAADKSVINYQIKNNWIHRGLIEPETVTFEAGQTISNERKSFYASFTNDRNYLKFRETSMVIVNRWPEKLPQHLPKVHFNYLVLRNSIPIKISDIIKHVTFDFLVFDLSNRTWKINEWINECRQLGLRFYNMNKEGAVVIEL